MTRPCDIHELGDYGETFFSSLTVAAVRRRQDLCEQQIWRAYEARNDAAMMRLQRMEQALMNEMLRRMP